MISINSADKICVGSEMYTLNKKPTKRKYWFQYIYLQRSKQCFLLSDNRLLEVIKNYKVSNISKLLHKT